MISKQDSNDCEGAQCPSLPTVHKHSCRRCSTSHGCGQCLTGCKHCSMSTTRSARVLPKRNGSCLSDSVVSLPRARAARYLSGWSPNCLPGHLKRRRLRLSLPCLTCACCTATPTAALTRRHSLAGRRCTGGSSVETCPRSRRLVRRDVQRRRGGQRRQHTPPNPPCRVEIHGDACETRGQMGRKEGWEAQWVCCASPTDRAQPTQTHTTLNQHSAARTVACRMHRRDVFPRARVPQRRCGRIAAERGDGAARRAAAVIAHCARGHERIRMPAEPRALEQLECRCVVLRRAVDAVAVRCMWGVDEWAARESLRLSHAWAQLRMPALAANPPLHRAHFAPSSAASHDSTTNHRHPTRECALTVPELKQSVRVARVRGRAQEEGDALRVRPHADGGVSVAVQARQVVRGA